MQLKQIARDALLHPLQAVSGIVERRHTLPILANVLLEHRDDRLYVTATDLEMQITAHSALPGKDAQATTVGARKLQDLLRALPAEATLNLDGTGTSIETRSPASGTEVRIPGLGKLGVLPKFDFGLELLYGEQKTSSKRPTARVRATSSTWRRPNAVSGGSPTASPSTTHSGCPWRTNTISTARS